MFSRKAKVLLKILYLLQSLRVYNLQSWTTEPFLLSILLCVVLLIWFSLSLELSVAGGYLTLPILSTLCCIIYCMCILLNLLPAILHQFYFILLTSYSTAHSIFTDQATHAVCVRKKVDCTVVITTEVQVKSPILLNTVRMFVATLFLSQRWFEKVL